MNRRRREINQSEAGLIKATLINHYPITYTFRAKYKSTPVRSCAEFVTNNKLAAAQRTAKC